MFSAYYIVYSYTPFGHNAAFEESCSAALVSFKRSIVLSLVTFVSNNFAQNVPEVNFC